MTFLIYNDLIYTHDTRVSIYKLYIKDLRGLIKYHSSSTDIHNSFITSCSQSKKTTYLHREEARFLSDQSERSKSKVH